MGPTRSAHRSTRRQQASQRGRTQPGLSSNRSQSGSHRANNTPLPEGYSLSDLIPIPGIADELPRLPKKSHARRQPAGHIPRPRNAFILFRCDFVASKLIPANVENNHRNISRIVGAVWRRLNAVQSSPWTTRAINEKREHKVKYPNYRYNPASSADGSSPSATTPLYSFRHTSSQASSPDGEYMFSGSDLSPSPAEDHEALRLHIPGQRSYSAPPDSGVLNTELRMPQPSVFPLPVSFFGQSSCDAASNAVPYAPAPVHPLGSVAPAYTAQATASATPGARPDSYKTVPVTPYAYDWQHTSASGLDLRRYHEILQLNPLHEHAESDEQKPTAEELAGAAYERAALPQEFLDPHMYEYASEYGYDAEPYLGSLDHYHYHGPSDVPHEPQAEVAWHSMEYTPYAAETSGAHSGYAAHLPGSFTPVDDVSGQSRDPVFGAGAAASTVGAVVPWAPDM